MIPCGERLREERERLNLNQDELAQRGGVQRRSQSNYERGERSPDASYLAAVAEHGVDVLYVITGSRSPDAAEAAERLALYGDAWEALETHCQRMGITLTPQKKRQAADALYQLCLERGGMNNNQDMVAALANMAA